MDANLTVALGSQVDLTLEADRGLAQAEVTLPDGTTRILDLEGSNRMTLGLRADRPGQVQIKVTDPNGLTAQTTVAIETRESFRHTPQFRLLSPAEGDCQVAEDANVTIAFQVFDEGGLGPVRLAHQQPDKAATVLDMPVEPGATSVTFSHTLDIKALGLRAGDCILFHASADETPDASQGQPRTFNSPIYMIEVRPKTGPQEPEPAGPPGVKVDTLLDVLEYTRALVKNTWAAMQAQGADGSPPDLKGLLHDVGYCHKALSRIRDDPNAGLSDGQKAAIKPILSDYDQAGQALGRADPAGALPAEERAYQALRLLVQEGPPQEPGQSLPDPNAADRPERVKIEDPNQQELLGRQASQQQDQDMGTLGDQLAALAQQQGRLKDQLSRLMQSQRDRAKEDQETADKTSSDSSQGGSSSESGQSGQSTAKASSGQGGQSGPSTGDQESSTPQTGREGGDSAQGRDSGPQRAANQQPTPEGSRSGQQASTGQGGQSDQSAGDAQSRTPGTGRDGKSSDRNSDLGPEGAANEQPTAKGSGRSGQRGSQGKGAGEGQERSSTGVQTQQTSGASASDRVAMLKAKQLAIQQQAKALSASMPGVDSGSKPEGSPSNQGQSGPSTDAASGVDSSVREAIARMDQALKALGQMQADGAMSAAKGQQAAQSMDEARKELAKVGAAAEDASERQAQAARLAKDLIDRAQALEKASLARQAQGLARQLSDAEALLKALGQPGTATVGGGRQASAPNLTTVLTRSPNVAPAELARRMAEQLRTASLGPGRRPGRVTQQEPTDLGFFESENAFYEAAAQPRTREP